MDVPMPAPKPAIVSKYEPMPLPRLGVAAKPFRSGSYHAGHNCPNCGTYQSWTHTGIANIPGHTHKCPKCSTVWAH